MKSNFPFEIPEGVVEVDDDYQKNLAHYELLHLKPKGTILFAKETREIPFQFFAGKTMAEGIFARVEEPQTPQTRRILDFIEKYPRTEALIHLTLLQFKMIFVINRVSLVAGSKIKTFHFNFPESFYKTHRRRFIRIPFNDTFPAELHFNTKEGPKVRKLRDLSREGMKLRLEEGDHKFITSGSHLRQACLKILDREVPIGLNVVSLYPGNYAGLKIVAISEEDRAWMKDMIRVLMKQILNLHDAPFDDQIEPDYLKKK